MTQYYEPEANQIEAMANTCQDPRMQGRLWAAARAIGTVVQWHDCGLCQKPSPGYTGPCRCDDLH